ncbi:MAG TPA: M48 family metallopeptidase [Pyrinomonadaceae bacterium]|nr:M48 family metallopeptidase [Pyrinomonadaceae bacterium]
MRGSRLIGWLLGACLLLQVACGGWPSSEGPLGLGGGAAARLAPRFNLFTPEQDVELGRMTAREYAGQLPLVEDERVVSYVQRLGERLAARAPGYGFEYRFAVVASPDVNAFALPGGFVFVNAGAVLAAESEGELAGVLAHEIAHVALRHGTNQASKAYLAKTGLNFIQAVTGGEETRLGKFVGSLGSAGAELIFLRFSRASESEADLEGARLMASAGYEPREMASFFSRLGERSVERPHELLSDHPHPHERVAAIERHARSLGVTSHEPSDAEFRKMKARLSARLR